MIEFKPATQFKKDLKKLSKSGSVDLSALTRVINQLQNELPLEPMIHRPHKLKGNWKGYMECHVVSISSNWILIYKIDEKNRILNLARTGTHSELFKK